jgi:hypothetical protein
MSSSREAVRCTLYDGTLSIHLDSESMEIPPQVLSKSQVLMDTLSVADPSVRRKVTLAAPEEWLQAWAACYCNKDESLGSKDVKDLVHCLLVCFAWNAHPIVPKAAFPADNVFAACAYLNASTLPDSLNQTLLAFFSAPASEGVSVELGSLQVYLKLPLGRLHSDEVKRAECRQLISLLLRLTCRRYVAFLQPGCLHLIEDAPRKALTCVRLRYVSAHLRHFPCS